MKQWLILISAIALSGCADMRNRPSIERIDAWFAKSKYTVSFDSTKNPTQLVDGLKASECLGWSEDSSGTAVVGPGAYAPVSVSVVFSADFGELPDGGKWASLNSDAAMLHDAVVGVRMYPAAEGGSRVMVAPVKRGVDDQIKASLEAGLRLCEWRNFSDPWRW